MSDKFITLNNITNILRESSINIILASGMTLIILRGGIDLSIGAIVAVAAVITVKVSLIPGFELMAVPIGILAGTAIGAAQGSIISFFKIPPFIVTLGGLSIWRGAAFILAGGTTLINNDINYAWLGNDSFLGIPWMIWIAFLTFFTLTFLLKKTKFGVHIYSVGGNEQAALFTGIHIGKVTVIIFSIMGLLAGLSGVLLSSRLYSANGFIGQLFELDAIAAVILGGTSFVGGSGGIIGTLAGALIIAVINNGLTLMHFSYYSQLVIKGLVIVIAVLIDVLRKRAN